jgi:hypothetical protein
VALEEILLRIQKLSKAERRKLLKELKRQELSEEKAAEKFDRAAGSWFDFDAEKFVNEIYARRLGSRGLDVEW